ncbi:sterile alpha motif domain-containing protein 9-like isoform X2 [Esox lucius]|nr:sterile alpha motif domain-containing protein 9-like isoform X2 [Esox lucius]
MIGEITPTLPTAEGELIPLDSELRDSLSFLDILCANEFEGEQIDPDVSSKTECDFYKGAPPKWMNFHLADERAAAPAGEKAVSVFKRDGYEKLRELIRLKQQGSWSVNTVRLMHHPGCGGTTLAMQVLWDLRKELRCAVLVDPFTDKKDVGKPVQKQPLLFDIKAAAVQVITLFTVGDPDKRNTVLLLQDNEHLNDPLQDCLVREIREQKLSATFPVVILLQCIRLVDTIDEEKIGRKLDLILKSSLSEKEKTSLVCKEQQLLRQHRDELRRFHSFKIMQHDFHEEYVIKTLFCAEGKEITKYVQLNRASCNTKLFAFLTLVSSYVPGSYLLQSQCEAFLSHQDPFAKNPSFEKRMEPFSDLIVTFSRHGSDDKRVCVAHPVLARHCVQLLTAAGVSRSSATLEFLQYLCRQEIQSSLLLFFKEMLTKREMTPKGKEMFSRLTIDIEKHEGICKCANVLKTASETFKHDPFYPQALARLYYIKLSDYTRAEIWAEKAKERVPTNSFIADTLGQVHKNHLYKQLSGKSGRPTTARDILFWAEKAIKAFKQEEELAEVESMTHTEDNPTKMSNTFNNRGIFGYLQVANIVYYSLTKLNPKCRKILTHEMSTEHLSSLFHDKKLMEYKTFITSLRLEVENKFYRFFESYFTYSEPRNQKDQTSYFQRDIVDCFFNYTRTPSQKGDLLLRILKDKMASTFPGISSLDKNTSESDLNLITGLWKVIHKERPDDINTACYILANIIQNCRPVVYHEPMTLPQLKALLLKVMEEENTKLWTPEFYLLVLLLFWPGETKEEDIPNSIDLNKYVECMKQAFENKYKKYLQSRELVPLFYLGKGSGLRRLVHRSNMDVICEQLQNSNSRRLKKTYGSAKIKENWFRDHLLRVNGVVEDHKAFACMADKKIEIYPQKQASVWKDGKILFYLGFNISGPMAFDIKYVQDKHTSGSMGFHTKESCNGAIENYIVGSPKACTTCDKMNKSTHWLSIEPSVSNTEGVTIYRHITPKGRHECQLSGLRWMCKSDVILKYQFRNWEPYTGFLGGMQYTQCGPLLDITVELGELEEVHLPHFACLGADLSLQEGMRILHVEDSGMSVEKVHEVTRFHAKLFHPTFSPKGVLLRSGFPLKVHCDLMVYLSKNQHLSLRTYLIPSDPSLVEAVEKQERQFGFKRHLVPRPERSLKIKSWFRLKTTCLASIDPEKIQLRYNNTTPSFFRVFVENPNIDFGMELICGNNTVWKAAIREAEIKDTVFSKAPAPPVVLPGGFVEKHRPDLIQRVSNALSIADDLLSQGIIIQEAYSKVKAANTSENQMRELLDAVILKGLKVEIAFLNALYKYNASLVEDMINGSSS